MGRAGASVLLRELWFVVLRFGDADLHLHAFEILNSILLLLGTKPHFLSRENAQFTPPTQALKLCSRIVQLSGLLVHPVVVIVSVAVVAIAVAAVRSIFITALLVLAVVRCIGGRWCRRARRSTSIVVLSQRPQNLRQVQVAQGSRRLRCGLRGRRRSLGHWQITPGIETVEQ